MDNLITFGTRNKSLLDYKGFNLSLLKNILRAHCEIKKKIEKILNSWLK